MGFDDVRLKGFSKHMKVLEAIKLAISKFSLLDPIQITLRDNQIQNMILREKIFAHRSIPPFNRSAVDGYAIKAEDTFSATETNPLLLKVTGTINIGEKPILKANKGFAIQIPTGAVVPEGADAVVMIEDTNSVDNDYIEVTSSLPPGKNISREGEDVRKNDLLFQSGHQFRSVDRGFLLSAGVQTVTVTKPPSIAIISTGDELQDPIEDLVEGKIPETNGINLVDLCIDEGWRPEFLGIIKDQKEELADVIKKAINKYDVIFLSGGTSVGKKDLVPIIMNELGEIYFHGLAMRPGGPILCGKVKEKIVFGIPGFPTATIIAFRFVVKPIIEGLLGKETKTKPKTIRAKISRNVASKVGRLDFLRVRLQKSDDGNYLAVPIQIGGSGILKNIIEADGFVQIPESSEGLKEGDEVEVILK